MQCSVLLILIGTVCRCKSLRLPEGDWEEGVEVEEQEKKREVDADGRTCTGALSNHFGWCLASCT